MDLVRTGRELAVTRSRRETARKCPAKESVVTELSVLRNNRCLLSVAVGVLALVSAACGRSSKSTAPPPTTETSGPTTTVNDPAMAQGLTARELAKGQLDTLPAEILYGAVLEIPQAPGVSNTISHKHPAGFVYMVAGSQDLAIQGSTTTYLNPGDAAFLPPDVVHSHINPGNAANDWYSISLRPTSARTAPPTFPGQKVVFATPDLAPLGPGPYGETLRLAEIQPGGRIDAHKHSGPETAFVLDGQVSVHIVGQPPMAVSKGQGFLVPMDTGYQAFNTGAGVARFLAYVVWPIGQPFKVPLTTSP